MGPKTRKREVAGKVNDTVWENVFTIPFEQFRHAEIDKY